MIWTGSVQGAREVLCFPVFLVCHVGDGLAVPLVVFVCSAASVAMNKYVVEC